MKKDNFDDLFNSQKEIQDEIKFDDVKKHIDIISRKRRINVLKLIIPISVLMLSLSLLIGFVINKQTKLNNEYESALEFFNENNLESSNLSKQDMIDIQNDIESNSFSLTETLTLINKVILASNLKVEIKTISSDIAKSVWEYWKQIREKEQEEASQEGYFVSYEDNDMYEIKTHITKKSSDGPLWDVKIDYYVQKLSDFGDHILVLGYTYSNDDNIKITKISSDGDIIWQKDYDVARNTKAVFIDDNQYVLFTSFYSNSFTLTKLDYDGNILSTEIKQIGSLFIDNVYKFSDFYLLVLKDSYDGENSLARMTKNGDIEYSFTILSDDYKYMFVDAIEYNGKLYLSSYAVPTVSFESNVIRGEISGIIEEIFEKTQNDFDDITDEYVMELVCDNYDAVFFVCDDIDGLIELDRIDGAIGNKITIEDEKIIWSYEKFVNAMFSPYTNSFSIGAVTNVYERYYQDGKILFEIKTDELLIFRR